MYIAQLWCIACIQRINKLILLYNKLIVFSFHGFCSSKYSIISMYMHPLIEPQAFIAKLRNLRAVKIGCGAGIMVLVGRSLEREQKGDGGGGGL